MGSVKQLRQSNYASKVVFLLRHCFFSKRFMKIGEKTPMTHIAIKTQQIGVEKRIDGSPSFNSKARRKPRSPMGPKMSPSTIAAALKSNLRIK